MSLWSRLWATITSNPEPGSLTDLRTRVEDLEANQVRREVEWTKTREQVQRHLQRVAAIEQRNGDHQAGEQDPKSQLRALVLAKKFPSANGA